MPEIKNPHCDVSNDPNQDSLGDDISHIVSSMRRFSLTDTSNEIKQNDALKATTEKESTAVNTSETPSENIKAVELKPATPKAAEMKESEPELKLYEPKVKVAEAKETEGGATELEEGLKAQQLEAELQEELERTVKENKDSTVRSTSEPMDLDGIVSAEDEDETHEAADDEFQISDSASVKSVATPRPHSPNREDPSKEVAKQDDEFENGMDLYSAFTSASFHKDDENINGNYEGEDECSELGSPIVEKQPLKVVDTKPVSKLIDASTQTDQPEADNDSEAKIAAPAMKVISTQTDFLQTAEEDPDESDDDDYLMDFSPSGSSSSSINLVAEPASPNTISSASSTNGVVPNSTGASASTSPVDELADLPQRSPSDDLPTTVPDIDNPGTEVPLVHGYKKATAKKRTANEDIDIVSLSVTSNQATKNKPQGQKRGRDSREELLFEQAMRELLGKRRRRSV